VCTITVNSSDERDVFRRYLPPDRYRFVELVEHGRSDWLASACRAQVRCDVLVVSGHFAGSEFYSSRPAVNETLKVSEIERAQCTESCPDVFSHLQEVYLFGCDTLKPEPVKSATPEIVRAWMRGGSTQAEAERQARMLSERYGESSRDLMRRLFAHVPVIYGFASLAPLGRVAGPMLEHYFESGPEVEVGSGRVSSRLLALFAPSSMVVTSGQGDDEPYASERSETCRYHDERQTLAQRIARVHELLAGEPVALRMSFERIEAFFAAIGAVERARPATAQALRTVASDGAAAGRFIALTRDTRDPALRLRMAALARSVGWLDADSERAEKALLVRDVVADPAMAYGEVELVCGLNADGSLDGAADELPAQRTVSLAQAAGLACLGSREARARVLKALASAHDDDVQVAQAYLRHRPVHEVGELRMNNFQSFLGSVLQRHPLEGGTYYGKAMQAIRANYWGMPGPRNQPIRDNQPVYVMFVTDGATFDESVTVEQLKYSAFEPIFWQFMAIGDSPQAVDADRSGKKKGFLKRLMQSDFAFLENLDNLPGRFIDNANFFAVTDPANVPDAQLFDLMMTEYPGWLQLARRAGMLPS